MCRNVLAGGVGLTLGYSEIENVVVLDTPEAVQSFTHGQTTLDTDITGAWVWVGGDMVVGRGGVQRPLCWPAPAGATASVGPPGSRC